MSVPILSELREPPVVGCFYMVPVVNDYPWHGRRRTWPVLGPMHDDAEFFNFSEPHYHLDIRFLETRQLPFVRKHAEGALNYAPGDVRFDGDLESAAVLIYPVVSRGDPLPKGRPALARRRCQRASFHCPVVDGRISKMRAHYGEPAEPIRLADGRKLCPHRKVDLSQFPPDTDGIVTCPLHGLRVRCAA